jgi:uncharacterized membrane protein
MTQSGTATPMAGVEAQKQVTAARGLKTAAWLLWLLACGAGILGLAFGVQEQATGRAVIAQTVLSYVAGASVAVAYASVGLALALRLPRLVIGWLFLGIGLVGGWSNMTWAYALLDAAQGRPPGPVDATQEAWLANAVMPSAWFILTTAMAVLFPDGKPVSRRWFRVLEGSVIGGIVLAACLALLPGPLVFYSFRINPFGAAGGWATLLTIVTPIVLGVMVTLTILSAWSMRVRYARAGPVEREQLKWFVWASGLFVVAAAIEIVVGAFFSVEAPRLADSAWLLFSVAAIAVPVAALIAITRYRLYDIDRLIGRTFVYGSLTAILAGLYAASIRLFTAVFVGVTGQSSDTALVLTTLVLATSFTPIKGRLETIAGERFRPAPAMAAAASGSADFEERVEEIARRVSRELISAELRRDGAARATDDTVRGAADPRPGRTDHEHAGR